MDCNRSQVQKFRELIVHILVPKEVLSHLMTLQTIQDVRERILDAKTKSNAAAILVDALLDSEEEGWYRIFLEALKKKGYEILSRTLEGYCDVKNPQMLERLLSLYYVPICEKVNPVELLSYLIQYGTIGKEDVEKIEAQQRNHGPSEAVLTLLDLIPRKKQNWFADLVMAFTECDYDYIVKDIDCQLSQAAKEGDFQKVQRICEELARDQSVDKSKGLPTRMDFEHFSNPGNTEVKQPLHREAPPGASVQERHEERMEADVESIDRAMFQQNIGSSTDSALPSIGLTIHDFMPGQQTQQPGSQAVAASQPVPSAQTAAATSSRQPTFCTDISSPPNSGVMVYEKHHSSHPGDGNASLFAPNKRPSSEQPPTEGQLTGGKRPSPLGAEALDTCQKHSTGSYEAESAAITETQSVESELLQLRPYQLELAKDAVEGKNSIIVAPTGSGKTHVALYITQQHTKNMDVTEDPKVVFVVPTVALVTQQHNQFKRYLPGLKSLGLRGDSEESLSLRLPMYDVFVLTPQILLNALEKEDVASLEEFSMIIFDECHHTNKNHPYSGIMRCYFQEKQDGKTGLPQVVGLTASVGVGKTNNVDRAIDHILKICANLDSRLRTVQKEKQSLDQHVNAPDEDAIEVKGRKHDPFHQMITGFMTKIEEHIRQLPDKFESPEVESLKNKLTAPSVKGSDPYTGWVTGLRKPVARVWDQTVRRVFVACLKHLKVYNDALFVNADCRTVDAWKFIKQELGEFEAGNPASHKDETDKWLENIFYDEKVQRALQNMCNEKDNANPKLEEVKKLLLQHFRENPELRAIVFCKTREMTEALKSWMNEDQELVVLNAMKLVGSHSSTDRGGMTAVAQEDVIKFFRDGKHKVIIATTVAEEGLDIQKCSLVIRYQHVTNETARIQAKGRGRDADSKYMVVAERERGIEKEEINRAREKLMHEAIDALLRKPEAEIEERIRVIQKEEQLKARQQEVAKIAQNALRQKSQNREDDFELRCYKCDELACFSSDIKHVENTLHMVVSSDFDDSIIIEPHPKPVHMKGDATKTGKIFCKRCKFDWGITGVYQEITYPIIKISSFVIISPKERRDTCKKWGNAPFSVELLTVADREAMIEKMNS